MNGLNCLCVVVCEVDYRDNVKERLILLFGRALVIIRYDFVARTALPYVRLNKITHFQPLVTLDIPHAPLLRKSRSCVDLLI